ncbi:acyl-CoA synthetase [Pseudoxanthomonas spadix]|uniref:acyl-CoA synthetase n=1 Tax=Pseudoxanthomonas spadix TaxID=415229 RepID=UPI000EFF7C1C|nr:acyl-CoA synthetase [Pseudoxanthomonas spadix]MBP3973932.1 acyl-CoA synthetase [Pseudoxanthomonas spadix]RMW95741.1 acyl-CoA synthetase [Pseudoxanthomonas spadix]
MSHEAYTQGLERNQANYTPLSPLSFLRKAALLHPQRVALIHGARRLTWGEEYRRCRQLASALQRWGVGRGDTVAAMLPNTPAMFELHYGPAMLGAVLNTLNTRLDAPTIAFMLDYAEAKVLLVDREFAPVIAQALKLCRQPPRVVDVDDAEVTAGDFVGEIEYEAFIAGGDAALEMALPDDEWDAISLNYTSGTTGDPKGVVYHHRGAYLNAVANIIDWSMPPHPVYLWTLPMFHCNGWCFPWTMAAVAGTQVCLRRFEPRHVLELMREHRVTHYCGAPIVHSALVAAPEEWKHGISGVHAQVAGAAPPAAVIEGMERMGFHITHVYGLTETYGPASLCQQKEEWSALDIQTRADLNSRQGVACLLQEDMQVLDPQTLQPVPWDGQTIGEIMFRGNITMKGYLKNPDATARAFEGGWFHTGDLAVVDPDGYVKIRDRSKDVIISGGENISSIEVEDALCRHPAVMAAAVVARPDEKWGETPCAFIELKAGSEPLPADALQQYCRTHLAGFKVPRAFVFGELPRTSTGKVQKFLLRERARDLSGS